MTTDLSSEISIRVATVEDLRALRQFEQDIIDAEREFDPTLKTEMFRYYDIETMILAENVIFLVAEYGDFIVGCGFAQIDSAKDYFRHAQQAYLGLMYVHPQYRGRSISRGILERLKTWCRAKGVMELRLVVYSDNLAAMRAYEKAGFSQYVTEMRIDLAAR